MSTPRHHTRLAATCLLALFAIVSTVGVRAYDAISVTGPFAEWTPTGVALTQEHGVWTGVIAFEAGETEFKITANKSWDTNWGAGAVISPPGSARLEQTGPNLRLKTSAAGEFRFIVDPDAGSITVIPHDESFSLEEFVAGNGGGADMPRFKLISIAGSFNDWLPGQANLAYEADGVWRGMVKLPAGPIEYKFPTNNTWEGSPSYGGFYKDPFIPQRGKTERVIPNNKLYVPVAGEYVVTFNDRTYEFAIEPGPDVVVPPKEAMEPFKFDQMNVSTSANQWELEDSWSMQRVGDHDWEWTGPLPKGEMAMKIAGNGSWDYSWGEFRGATAEVPGGGRAALDAPDIHINLPADGLYTITFNDFSNEWRIIQKGAAQSME